MQSQLSGYYFHPQVLTLGILRSHAVAFEISKLLDCGLDKESLAILVSLCEYGVNPDALATVVQELRRDATTLWTCVLIRRIFGPTFHEPNNLASSSQCSSTPGNSTRFPKLQTESVSCSRFISHEKHFN